MKHCAICGDKDDHVAKLYLLPYALAEQGVIGKGNWAHMNCVLNNRKKIERQAAREGLTPKQLVERRVAAL